jgi:uracil-DNA glycosylase
VTATTHPASILRAPDSASREQQRREFVNDLKKVADFIQKRQNAAA